MIDYPLGVCVISIGNHRDTALDDDTISYIAAPEKSYLTPSAWCHFHAAYLDAAPGKPASRRVRRAGVQKKGLFPSLSMSGIAGIPVIWTGESEWLQSFVDRVAAAHGACGFAFTPKRR
jgi:hypothetical protein